MRSGRLASFMLKLMCGLVEGLANSGTKADQVRQIVQSYHIRTIAQCLVRSGMGFNEDSITTRRNRRAGQIGHHSPVSARAVALAPWSLYAVSGVKDHGPAKILHPRNGSH